ncbi:MAG: hypothetical protein KAS72_00140 [Phycisphaerales bacterium]|nr:hypothetical protein [Phycisphaerales bacterium]
MRPMSLLKHPFLLALTMGLLITGCSHAPEEEVALTEPTQPPTPANLKATDHPLDKGEKIDLTWDLTEADVELIDVFEIHKAITQVGDVMIEPSFELLEAVPAKDAFRTGGKRGGKFIVDALNRHLTARELKKLDETLAGSDTPFQVGKMVYDSDGEIWDDHPTSPISYVFKIIAVGRVPQPDGEGEADENAADLLLAATQRIEPLRAESAVTDPITPGIQLFDGRLGSLCVIVLIISLSVIYFIIAARSGKPLKIRKIAGLEAVDEAVGRATEMGRSCLFIPGILDMNDIQTIAAMTVLARVSKTAAEYDAKVEVPNCRSLVMTTARETVQAAFLAAGRPDAYNENLIYYVTDDQFGYVAYLQGMMVRDKPAACFYMGAFFAESLILAETGNSIGAIQVAGTAMPAQLPFFVAACDYTLIGEEFFAASAYLSGEPDQLGSLKGQDVGKVIVAIGLLVGAAVATVATITASPAAWDALNFILDKILA